MGFVPELYKLILRQTSTKLAKEKVMARVKKQIYQSCSLWLAYNFIF